MEVLITKSTEDGAFVVTVDGELDMFTAPALKEALFDGISQGHRQLVVDLTRVGFLDSTTLGVLVGGLRRVRAEQGNMHLVVDHPHLNKMFRITGFDAVFPIHKSLEDALRASSADA